MESIALFLCLFPLWGQLLRGSSGMQIDLYTQKFKFGQSLNMDISDKECTNVPRPWSNVTMSVDTHERCMQFYDRKSCRGRIAVLQPFHSVHQMDLSLINFHNVIQSISPCGANVPTGRYVIQSVVDASILTVSQFPTSQTAHVHTLPPRPFIPKAQQWELTEKQPMEYDIMPRILEANIPVTYDSEAMIKRRSFIRNVWKVESVGKGRYVFKNGRNGRCLYKTRFHTIAEIDCRAWSPNQEWILRPLLSFQNANTTAATPAASSQQGSEPGQVSDKNGKKKQKPVKGQKPVIGDSKRSSYKIISQRKNLKPIQKHVTKDMFRARSQQMESPTRKQEDGSGSEEDEEDDEESDEEDEETQSDERSRMEERELAQDSDEDSVQRVAGFMKLLLKGVSNKMQEDERAEEEEIEVFER